MSKNIVLLSDGTGNSARSTTPTNIGRLYSALRADDPARQAVFYDDGVGTERVKVLRMLGGAFGYGLKANVLDMYKFLCRAYEDGDRIYLFGFSRGAYTVRILVGLVHRCGLIPDARLCAEADLDRQARANYREFRKDFHLAPTRVLHSLTGRESTPDAVGAKGPPIWFLGVWDTVDAYGLPVDELAVFWDKFVYPFRFTDRTLSESVRKARHAVALDDERHTFHPVLWDESDELDPDRIEQVWFAGVHANVGGGYPDDTLARVSLDWMLSHLEDDNGRSELVLIDPEVLRQRARRNVHGKLYDSRSGLQAYYRYKPRSVAALCNATSPKVAADVKIHQTVFDRIAAGVVAYSPIGIPADYKIVAARGGTPPAVENADQKAGRMAALAAVWRAVAWLRGLYKALIFATAVLAATPTFLHAADGPVCAAGAPLCELYLGLFQLLGSALPDFARYWLEPLKANPAWFGGLLVTFGAIVAARSAIWGPARRQAALAWSHLRAPHPAAGPPPEGPE